MTNTTAIFWPMIAQVALIYVIYWRMSVQRVGAVKRGEAKPAQFRENRIEPESSLFLRNNLVNQFELPVLFFPVVIALYLTGGANWFAVALAWAFVASRAVHAWIHVTTNRIRHRRPAFIAGFVILGALWVWFAWCLLTLG